MFMFGLLKYGGRGIEDIIRSEPSVNNLQEYGVDWEALDNPRLMAHFEQQNNTGHRDGTNNAFAPASAPERLSEVICDEPGCPLTAAQISALDQQLAARVDVSSQDMSVRQVVWQVALDLCLSGRL
ncbi:hypothetical protein BV20DRAFT_453787 [Pilatotrama ljubarskyi]|nr:hypothetical protein BV20DRAFT_453787 [Pilatotrama ljubarskyi]